MLTTLHGNAQSVLDLNAPGQLEESVMARNAAVCGGLT